MKRKLYARELFEKIATREELEILKVAWDDSLDVDEKIRVLLKKKEKVE